jgi:pimeloyl-ACP methyl ester carboxylesterase
MMGSGPQGSNENEVGWPSDAKIGDARERNASMLCNDMNKSETASFVATLGSDAWPTQMYSHTDWQFDGLDEVPATYVVCLRDRILPVTWQTKFAQRLHAHRLVHIDSGHQVMNSRPHALAEILRHEAGIGRR